MTKEKRAEAINYAWEGMEWAQALQDCAETPKDQKIARSLYESFWCLYLVLLDDRRKGGKNGI